MSEPQNLGKGGVLNEYALLAVSDHELYVRLGETLDIAIVWDRDAGFGALNGMAMWFTGEFTRQERDALLTLSKGHADVLYLLLRADNLKYWPQRSVRAAQLASGEIEWGKLLDHVRSFLPDFGGPDLTGKIEQYGKGQCNDHKHP